MSVTPIWLLGADPPFFTPEERAQPMAFDSIPPGISLACASLDLLTGPVTVKAEGKTDAQIAMAIMDFTMWWSQDVQPRLNGFQGWDCIDWNIERGEVEASREKNALCKLLGASIEEVDESLGLHDAPRAMRAAIEGRRDMQRKMAGG